MNLCNVPVHRLQPVTAPSAEFFPCMHNEDLRIPKKSPPIFYSQPKTVRTALLFMDFLNPINMRMARFGLVISEPILLLVTWSILYGDQVTSIYPEQFNWGVRTPHWMHDQITIF
ncbi:hypothetical protein CRM22_009962 [Opisthorchis felineus]|uniref:Uncharacterized protein n=1 Tax=Opisthorchis felineus TaxID=147828 RepID=A0A4S2L389_OPIFE|nr:hypothetical protein CRM22_009962 [Opisthorchis felineus]